MTGAQASPHLLAVVHSRTGSTARLADAALDGARQVPDVELRVLDPLDAGPDDVTWADALLLATPARFGWMSGAMKDFFERIYHPCLETTVGRPYALVVKGDTDVDGAVASVERIATGLRWRRVLPPLSVVGPIDEGALAQAMEIGATLAAGMEAGLY